MSMYNNITIPGTKIFILVPSQKSIVECAKYNKECDFWSHYNIDHCNVYYSKVRTGEGTV
jgi:hypothetical protein